MRVKAFILIVCIALGMIIASCGGMNKTCPAYSKVNSGQTHDVRN